LPAPRKVFDGEKVTRQEIAQAEIPGAEIQIRKIEPPQIARNKIADGEEGWRESCS
jgi:hypothetical protein